MIVSNSLSTIPFLSSSDATRLQMSSKQLNQAITNLNCERPYTISSDWIHLSNSSNLFKCIAEYDGEILYTNDDILVVCFYKSEENIILQTLETPKYFPTTDGFAISLRYKKDEGKFQKGELLFEYDSFIDNLPCPGYRLNSAFFNFFGINFQDAIVITESAAKRMRSIKYEKQLIFVYSYSIFKTIYPESKYGFIPEAGQSIDGKVVYCACEPKNNKSKNVKQYLQSLNIIDFSEVINDKLQFNTEQKYCKIENSTISNIKIHRVNNLPLIDKTLQSQINYIIQDYKIRYSFTYKDLVSILGPEYSKQIMSNHYIMVNFKNLGVKLEELVYVIELDLIKDIPTRLGDKLANRLV
jgi:hypothetical protein